MTPNRNINGLTQVQMQYVKTINLIVDDVIHLPQGMTKILDHLYLGGWMDARNIALLETTGITHICNTVEDNRYASFYSDYKRYLGFSSEDSDSYPIMDHFDAVYDFIESTRKDGGKCLIHCMAGINRSGCLATAYLMVLENI